VRDPLAGREADGVPHLPVMTCSSSMIAREGFQPCSAPGSAGSTTSVESVRGTYSRDWNT
jgi:hypothetical protein